MRVVVVGAVALLVVLGGFIVAIAVIDPVETSSPNPASLAPQSDGSALTSGPAAELGVPLPAVEEGGTPIKGQRPHLTVIDGATNIRIPGSLASSISLLPQTTAHFPDGAASLDDVNLGDSPLGAQVPAVVPITPLVPVTEGSSIAGYEPDPASWSSSGDHGGGNALADTVATPR